MTVSADQSSFSKFVMLFTKLAAATAVLPLLFSNPSAVLAQGADPYADWRYLYEDSFENTAGQEIAQQWWLSPSYSHQGSMLNFTLLARRSPVSDNGTTAALFGYVADCGSMVYSIEETQFLDVNNQVIDVQTYQRPMEAANPESPFYEVLENLCSGVY